MVRRMVAFNPIRMDSGSFRCFWSLDSGWGQVEIGPDHVDLHVLYGSLELQSLRLPFLADDDIASVTLGTREVAFSFSDGVLQLESAVTIVEHDAVRVTRK